MKNVAVIMGGYSSEKEISIKSGQIILDHLDSHKYHGYGINVTEDRWYHKTASGQEINVNKNDFSLTVDDEKIIFNCVYNTIHGTPGEDGKFQAYLEMIQIPQTSAASYQSAITFNKRDCLAVLKPWDILTGKHVYVNQEDYIDIDKIITQVGLPCFVKANRSGSSFGVSKVYHRDGFEKALETAFAVDNEIIIESFLDGMEISVGVYKLNDEIIALPPTEIVSENDFFDYEAKYEGKSQEITPARLDRSTTSIVQILSKRIYKILKLKGIARADFIFHNGEPHFIEINTNPGMSAESIVPQQIKAAGNTLKEFLSQIIEDTIKQHAK
ncbi:D-alanine--D-alanine ligase [Nonlabens ponticola]|uniref:D-alanine--D-alanine ligase n=1 Tax=Nonlabens ponticola TaxID=2496866 RepID=A0A3S9N128_9FLAO|nr:D-alanine--D-alanine ligase [Nonlabens ponticola]AZQ45023.1 D-alanine--D-alanine ligase [Nonlabens ponticola]